MLKLGTGVARKLSPMCGIAGFVTLNPSSESSLVVERMTAAWLERVNNDLTKAGDVEFSEADRAVMASPEQHEMERRMLNEAFRTETRIVRDETEVSDRSLVADRYWQETGGHRPSWTQMVAELAGDPTDYRRFRTLAKAP